MTEAPVRPPTRYVAEHGPVRLRAKQLSDAAADYAWRRDPETARRNAQVPLAMSLAEYAARLDEDLRLVDPARLSLAIESLNGEHVGNIMYYHGNGETAELGISIGLEAARGQGLGTAAVVAFLRYTWETTPLRGMYLHTLEWNEPARRSFRRAGFEATARVYRDGQWFERMEVRREWWLLWDMEGRFAAREAAPRPPDP